MNRLIIICGNSGSGKSTLIREFASKYENVEIIKKYTTREIRSDESNVPEVQAGCSKEFMKQFEYSYKLLGNIYGFSKLEIDNCLSSNKNPIIIIGNAEMFDVLLKEYGKIAMPIFIIRESSISELMKNFEQQKRSDKEIETRLQNINIATTDVFNPRIECFEQRIILNSIGLPKKGLDKQFKFICDKFDVDLGKTHR